MLQKICWIVQVCQSMLQLQLLKAIGNIVGFINSMWPSSTNKQPNCIFEAREGNQVFLCAIKSITTGEELLIDYNLNWIHKDIAIMGAVIWNLLCLLIMMWCGAICKFVFPLFVNLSLFMTFICYGFLTPKSYAHHALSVCMIHFICYRFLTPNSW